MIMSDERLQYEKKLDVDLHGNDERYCWSWRV